MEETSTGQQNHCLRGQECDQPISEHSEEDDLFPIASLRRQSKSSSSASFLKVLGVGNVHRNASNASWPCLFICIGESQEESCALIWYFRRLACGSFFLSICRLTTSYNLKKFTSLEGLGHRNSPCEFLRKHFDQIEEVVRLRGIYEDSPARSVDCTFRFTKTMQRPRLYLKPGWLCISATYRTGARFFSYGIFVLRRQKVAERARTVQRAHRQTLIESNREHKLKRF